MAFPPEPKPTENDPAKLEALQKIIEYQHALELLDNRRLAKVLRVVMLDLSPISELYATLEVVAGRLAGQRSRRSRR